MRQSMYELSVLLKDAAERGGGAFVLNLATGEPFGKIEVREADFLEEGSDYIVDGMESYYDLVSGMRKAAKEMKAEKIIVLLPEDSVFDVEGVEIVTAPRSLVLRETPAALHFLATGELRACPDERTYPTEGPDGKPAVVADAALMMPPTAHIRYQDKHVFYNMFDVWFNMGVTPKTPRPWPEVPLRRFMDATLFPVSDKPVLVGGLTGRMLPLDAVVADGSDYISIRLFDAKDCMADVAAKLFAAAREESCQKCVLCREGAWHLATLFSDITGGKGTRESLAMITDIASLIARGAFCSFGRGMAELALSIVETCRAELEAHIARRQCPAGVCAAFKRKTYAIDPKKCAGNGDCADECPEDAITFKRNFISMIDKDMCTGCGKCAEACEEGAIVLRDGKMRVPDKPTRIGRFK